MREQKEKFNKEIENTHTHQERGGERKKEEERREGEKRREERKGEEGEERGGILKNTMTELHSTESFNSRLKQAEERFRELEDKPSDTSQLE